MKLNPSIPRLLLSALILVFIPIAGRIVIAGGPESRLVAKQPEQRPFVKTSLGYMVPYEQRIPGSNHVIEMIPVPGGRVTLQRLKPGAMIVEGEDAKLDRPIDVEVPPFWIGKYEITMGQFMPYRRLYYDFRRSDGDDRLTADEIGEVDAVSAPSDVYDPNFRFEFAQADNSAAASMSQFCARHYTKWLSLLTETDYRLPLRSEWQHACAAGSSDSYCFGNNESKLNTFAIYRSSEETKAEQFSTVVGRRRANDWGIFDMHGNVSEFVIEDTAKQGVDYGHVACGGNFYLEARECTIRSVLHTNRDWWIEDPEIPMSPHWMSSDEARMVGFRIISPLHRLAQHDRKIAWEPDTKRLANDLKERLNAGRGALGRIKPVGSQ